MYRTRGYFKLKMSMSMSTHYLDTSALPEVCLTCGDWGPTEYYYISYGSVVGGEREGQRRGRLHVQNKGVL